MPDTDDYLNPDRREATIKPGREIKRSAAQQALNAH